MGFAPICHETSDREPTLDDDIGTLDDDDVFDFANLTEVQTGVSGFITITSVMGRQGPRVKYFSKLGRHQPSFSVSIAAEPRVLSSSLPDAECANAGPSVVKWVAQNHDALLGFWNDGQYWSVPKVERFVAHLSKA